jgi:hypothetical protein
VVAAQVGKTGLALGCAFRSDGEAELRAKVAVFPVDLLIDGRLPVRRIADDPRQDRTNDRGGDKYRY